MSETDEKLDRLSDLLNGIPVRVRTRSVQKCTLTGWAEPSGTGAAASVREGLHETLTVVRLGLTGALHRTLRSTNAIENLNGSVQRYTRNVKRWRDGEMIQRWVSAALLDAERRFRRVRGFRDMPRLMLALDDPSALLKQPEKAA